MIGGLGKLSRYLLAGAGVIGLMASGAPEAKAQNMQEIQAQINAMQGTIKALQKQVQDAKAQASAAQTTADTAKGSDLDLKIKWKGAPELSSADGKFKMKVRGRLDTDYNAINQDTSVTFTPDVSATALRRARLGVEGVMFYDVKYILEVDFAGDAVAVKDAFIQYTGFDVQPIIGNYKTYNSLEHLTSSNFITFMERAAFIEAFGIDRQIGAGLSYNKDHFTLGAGIFGEGPSSAPEYPGFTGDENLTFAARGTVAPINREVNGVNQVLHFGASVRTREVGDDQPYLQYQARAADLFLANRFVNTGRISESDTLWGLEAAGVWGPLSVQGEYAQLEVDLPTGAVIRNVSTSAAAGTPPYSGGSPTVTPVTTISNPFLGVPNPTYSGWYVDASLFLTGETRPYKEGRFDRVKVKNPVTWSKGGGWGAWQIAGRYDVLDLSDEAFNTAFPSASNFTGGCANTRLGANSITAPASAGAANPIRIAQCGEQETWIIGVNWYLNDYVKLMFNYTQSDLSGYPVTTVTANTSGVPTGTKVSGFDGATIRGFGMRAHVDW